MALRTHEPEQCAGQACCIHNPSDHHMRDWPLCWRSERRLMERVCPHGVGHPDPDHLAHARSVPFRQGRYDPDETHSCDGCCAPEGYQAFATETDGFVSKRAIDSLQNAAPGEDTLLPYGITATAPITTRNIRVQLSPEQAATWRRLVARSRARRTAPTGPHKEGKE